MPLQATGASLTQLMLGRQIHCTLSTLEADLLPEWQNFQKVWQLDNPVKLHYSYAYDSRYKVLTCKKKNCVSVKLDNERGLNGLSQLLWCGSATHHGHTFSIQIWESCGETGTTSNPDWQTRHTCHWNPSHFHFHCTHIPRDSKMQWKNHKTTGQIWVVSVATQRKGDVL